MYRLRLNAKQCISCGICMDVCLPQAIAMRTNGSNCIEGEILTYVRLHGSLNTEHLPRELMTFPYLIRPDRCDGCGLCVKECPVLALELYGGPGLSQPFTPGVAQQPGTTTFHVMGQDERGP